MADEPATIPEQDPAAPDSPPPESGPPEGTPAAPAETTSPEEVNWEQRYKDTQAAYTQSQQRAAQADEYERVVAAAQQGDLDALAALGFEPAEDPDAEPEDPIEALTAQVQTLQDSLATQQQSQAESEQEFRINQFLDTEIAALEAERGRPFSSKAKDAIESLALMHPDEQGQPGVRAANATLYQDILEEERQNWIGSKQADQPGSGTPGSPTVDMRDEQQRRAEMARIIEAGQSEGA